MATVDLTDPIRHLLDELTPVAEYTTIEKNTVDILLEIRNRLSKLREHEQEQREASGKIGELILEGRYADAASAFETRLGPSERTPAQNSLGYAALVSQGIQFYRRGIRMADATEADELLGQAAVKFEEAIKIKPDGRHALNGWASTQGDRAYREKDPLERDRLFRGAVAKYEEILKIDPDFHDALYGLGGTLVDFAERTSDASTADALLDRAESVLKRALELGPGETYNLACLSALRGRTDDCHRYLLTAKKNNDLPSLDRLKTESQLDSVRNQPWFHELIRDKRRQRNKLRK